MFTIFHLYKAEYCVFTVEQNYDKNNHAVCIPIQYNQNPFIISRQDWPITGPVTARGCAITMSDITPPVLSKSLCFSLELIVRLDKKI